MSPATRVPPRSSGAAVHMNCSNMVPAKVEDGDGSSCWRWELPWLYLAFGHLNMGKLWKANVQNVETRRSEWVRDYSLLAWRFLSYWVDSTKSGCYYCYIMLLISFYRQHHLCDECHSWSGVLEVPWLLSLLAIILRTTFVSSSHCRTPLSYTFFWWVFFPDCIAS